MSNFNSTSRRNSSTSLVTMESRATASSGYDVTRGVRSGSTTNLMDLDGSFMKPTIKKPPSTVGAIVVGTGLPSAENFHKTNNGTYYFPNGEIFRPRTGVSKRHRPCKINTHSYTNNYYTTANKAKPESLPRSSSFSSLSSLKSGSSSATYMTKSQSFTNIKQKNKQSLARNLRNNRLDTATNIEFIPNPPYSRSSSIVKGSPPNQKLQSSNITKNGSFISLADDHQKLSDSNPSSLSNYNLNRSSSTTPTTSIETSEEVVDPLDSSIQSEYTGEDNLSTLNELSEENIKPTRGNTLKSENRIVSCQDKDDSLQQETQSSSKETVFADDDNLEKNTNKDTDSYYKDSNTDNDSSSYYTDASNKQDEGELVMDMPVDIDESKINISQENITEEDTESKYEGDDNRLLDVECGNEKQVSPDERNSVATTKHVENHLTEENKSDIMENSDIVDEVVINNDNQNMTDNMSDRYVNQEAKDDDYEINENSDDDISKVNETLNSTDYQSEINEISYIFDVKSGEENKKDIEGIERKFKNSDSPRNAVYYEFPSSDKFNKFMNDDQTVPPRGDVVVVSEKKIRKHERASSSISSFNSIIYHSESSITKRQHSPTVESHVRFKSCESPLIENIENLKENTNQDNIESPLHINLAENSSNVHGEISTSDYISNDNNDILSESSLSNTKQMREQVTPEDEVLKGVHDDEAAEQDVSEQGITEQGITEQDIAEQDIDEQQIAEQEVLNEDTPNQGLGLSKQEVFTKDLPKQNSIHGIHKEEFPMRNTTISQTPLKSASIPSNSSSNKSKVKRSSSLANLKSFMKKFFTPAKELNKNPRKAESLHSRSETKTSKGRKPFKTSISLTSLRPATHVRKVTKLEENELPDSNSSNIRLVNVKEVAEVPKFDKLPTIETENDIFEDLMNVFDERMKEEYIESTKPKIPKFSNEPFLRDDELTRDQIKDQQIKDFSGEDDAFLQPSSNNVSDDDYFDENLKFLQEELMWTNIVDFDNLGLLSHSRSIRKSNNKIDKPQEFSINREELIEAFKNLNVYQKRNLPIHLKYIGQFKDFEGLKVSVEYFDGNVIENIMKKDFKSTPILKEGFRDSNNKKVSFSNKISINETFAPDMYKRYNKSVTQYTLTEPLEINKIKDEMNRFKCNEMLVHEESKDNTHFFY